MNLTCERCEGSFEAATFLGYCPECAGWFRGGQRTARASANPTPGVHLSGKFREATNCPRQVTNPFTEEQVCGLCGSDDLEPGYGFAGGFGLGMYVGCDGCGAVLDFCEDRDDDN